MTTDLKQKGSILMVDDDQFLLDMYAMKFSESGFEVQAMASSEQALEYLRKGATPKIVLLDVMMPVVTGFDFLETIKKEGLATGAVFIMLTNQGQQEDIEKAMALGADGYIIKASAIPSEVLQKTVEIAGKGKIT